MPKRGDYRYVDRNGNPITKAVYDKYAKNDGGRIQYFDGKNRGSTKISGGKYTAPESINTSDLSYSVDDVNAIREKYGDMAVDEYSNILDVDPNKTGTLIGKDKEYTSNDFTGNNNIDTTSTGTPNTKANDTVITQQVPNTKPKNTNRRRWGSNTNTNQDSLENRQQLMQQQIDEDNAARADLANRQNRLESDIAQDNAARAGNDIASREQIYSEAVARYAANPNAFTPQQRDLLVRVGEQLGISPEQTAANILRGNNPTATTVPTNTNTNTQSQPQPTAAPRVAPTVAPNNNDVSNYGGRYGAGDGNDYTNRTQGANNAARFWL